MGALVSVPVSVALWWYFDALVVLLFLPFVPLLFRDVGDAADGLDAAAPRGKTCPECGFGTTDPSFDYCPRDGRRLEGSHR